MKSLFKRTLAMMVALVLLLASGCIIVLAVEVSSVLEETISSDNYNELSVQLSVRLYFEQRKAFLQGKATTIENVNVGLIADELAHLEEIEKADVIWLNSEIVINNVACFDSHAEAIVMERVTFEVENVQKIEVVAHTIQLGKVDNETILIVCDGYLENTTGFRSCSYVNQATASTMTTQAEGSGMCLITVAKNEEGVEEQPGNVTKYGDTDGSGWCIAFISWCARQAGIPETVIKHTYGPANMRSFFVNMGRYYSRNSSYTPKPGDIYFGSDDGSTVSHGGIVYAVDENNVYTVDGNWANMVQLRVIARTSTYILGYGSPQYNTTGHNYSYLLLNDSVHKATCTNCSSSKTESHTAINDIWYSDETYHWQECACGKHVTQTTHTYSWQSNSIQHWLVCSICQKTTTAMAHVFVYDSTLGRNKCRLCGVSETIIMNVPPDIEIPLSAN